jgi:hypothetical protein
VQLLSRDSDAQQAWASALAPHIEGMPLASLVCHSIGQSQVRHPLQAFNHGCGIVSSQPPPPYDRGLYPVRSAQPLISKAIHCVSSCMQPYRIDL